MVCKRNLTRGICFLERVIWLADFQYETWGASFSMHRKFPG